MKRTIIINDTMQKNFRYEATAPVGKNFDKEFKPELTPKQMLQLGVFGTKGGKFTSLIQKPKKLKNQ